MGCNRAKMVVFGQSACLLAKWLYQRKVVAFGQLVVIGQGCGIRARVVVLGKIGRFRCKVVLFGQSDSNRAKEVVFVQKLLFSGKVVLFGQMWLYSGKCRSIRRLSLKLQQQGYKYQQLMKSFHKFYRSHSDELKKFGTTLMELRSSI